MKKYIIFVFSGCIFLGKAQSQTVTLDEQFKAGGHNPNAYQYTPPPETPKQDQSVFPDWVNKIKKPVISEDIRPEIKETVKQIKTKPTVKEPDKVQEVFDEMFPNKIPVAYEAPVSQTVKPVGQKSAISVYEYQNSKNQNGFDIDRLLNILTMLFLMLGVILFFIWFISKNKAKVKFNTPVTPETKNNQLSYSQREELLKETLIESAKQTLVSDLREMEIRGILEDRGITIQTLLRTYQEISLDQSNEYSKSVNLPKIEVEKIIKNVYQMLKVQYFKSTI
jgi:hypothetical protein